MNANELDQIKQELKQAYDIKQEFHTPSNTTAALPAMTSTAYPRQGAKFPENAYQTQLTYSLFIETPNQEARMTHASSTDYYKRAGQGG